MFDDDGFDALDAGLAYAGYRHGQDQQTAAILNGIAQHASGPTEINVTIEAPEPERHAPINALDFSTVDMPDSFETYIGQDPLKRQISVYMAAAKARGDRFPHTLLASGYPGVGKTTMARLIAKAMGVNIYEMVPPFHIDAVAEAAGDLNDGDILFIDEIHKLADNGGRGAEFLLKMLEDGVIFMPSGEVIELPNITVIGATTEPDKLPTPVIDRFKVQPYFQPYSWGELSQIAVSFAYRHDAADLAEDDDLMVDLAAACRSTPRIVEKMIEAARDLESAFNRAPNAAEVLDFLEIEPDGLTRTHIHYLTAMRQYFARLVPKSENEFEYIVGEAAIMQILRETKPGIQRVEAFLVERGLIDRTPRGRRLTPLGIARAEEFIAAGKGAANVA